MDLTIVDLAAPLAAQAKSMAVACETHGFFRIPVSVVSPAVVDGMWQASQDFFALPAEEKQSVEFPQPGYPYGYSPFRSETLALSRDHQRASPADLKESFSVGPDCGDHVAFGSDQSWVRSPTPWPDRPLGLRAAFETYYRELSAVAENLMRVMAVALDLPETFFEPLIDRPITSMRAVHYPAVNSPPDEAMRAGAHTDYGTLTILRTDDVAGLEIEDRAGAWHPVESDPHTFVVNLGDTIEQWTGGRWQSTMHRVSLASDQARHSIAFFHMANWDAMIECVPTCPPAASSEPTAPIQAGPWLMKKFQATV